MGPSDKGMLNRVSARSREVLSWGSCSRRKLGRTLCPRKSHPSSSHARLCCVYTSQSPSQDPKRWGSANSILWEEELSKLRTALPPPLILRCQAKQSS